MAKRIIIKDGDPVLRKKAHPVTEFDQKLHILLDDMRETMKSADGVGIAAPQVGILRRAAIVEVEPGKLIELINPEITASSGSEEGKEGCLSFPNIWGVVKRPTKVTVRALDRYGKEFSYTGTGFEARALCHETDHLDGIVFVDKVERFVDVDE